MQAVNHCSFFSTAGRFARLVCDDSLYHLRASLGCAGKAMDCRRQRQPGGPGRVVTDSRAPTAGGTR